VYTICKTKLIHENIPSILETSRGLAIDDPEEVDTYRLGFISQSCHGCRHVFTSGTPQLY